MKKFGLLQFFVVVILFCTSLPEVFPRTSAHVKNKTIQITFSVNLKLQRLAGILNPATDSVSVRGTFNDWQNSWMHPSTDSSDVYTTTIGVDAAVGDTIGFKFFIRPTTWEYDYYYPHYLNRYIAVTPEIYDSGFVDYYASTFNRWANVLNSDCTVLFICNTNGAKIKGMPEGTPFKTLHIFGHNSPLKWPQSTWPNSDSTLGIQMYDDGTHGDKIAGDKIFSNQFTFQKFTSAVIEYKYSANWGLPENGGSNDNDDTDMYRMIYVLNGVSNDAVDDTFGITRSKYLTDVNSSETPLPTSFALEQNYPNPFNPETVISYQLAASSFVTLKVYDILGNEIASLVNEEQPAGTHQVKFSGKNRDFSSGIYFHQLRAGDFVQTKKMILLK